MTATNAPKADALRPRPWLGAVIGAAVALIGNTAVFVVATALNGAALQASTDGTQASDLPYGAVAVASVIPLFVGAAILWVLSRFVSSSLLVWTVIASAITALSLIAPFFLPVDGGSKAALVAMHIVAGVAAIAGQRWAASRGSRASRVSGGQ